MTNRLTENLSNNLSINFVSNTTKNTACQFHQTYELCFFSKGHRTYMINSDTFDVGPNSIIVIPPYIQHSTCGTTSATRTVIYFTKDFLFEYFSPAFANNLLSELSEPLCILTHPRDNISSLVNNLSHCHSQNQKASAALYFAMILNSIKNAHRLPHKEKEDIKHDIAARAIIYIEKNFSSISSLMEISKALKVSLSYLETIFRKNTGLSLMQYVIKSRLNYGAKQLIETEDPIEKIAIDCGFSSSTHFSNTFKKHMEHSPREYRKHNKSINIIKSQS